MPKAKKSAPVTVGIHITVSQQFLSDILTSIAESCPETASWMGDENTTIKRIKDGEDWLQPLSVLSITARYDREEDAEGGRGGKATLDMPAIVRGLQLVPGSGLHESYIGAILAGMAKDDAGGQMDSTCFDAIAQLAIFGKVIYG